jgi:hypothetical protein
MGQTPSDHCINNQYSKHCHTRESHDYRRLRVQGLGKAVTAPQHIMSPPMSTSSSFSRPPPAAEADAVISGTAPVCEQASYIFDVMPQARVGTSLSAFLAASATTIPQGHLTLLKLLQANATPGSPTIKKRLTYCRRINLSYQLHSNKTKPSRQPFKNITHRTSTAHFKSGVVPGDPQAFLSR